MDTIGFSSFEVWVLNQLGVSQGFLLDPNITITDTEEKIGVKIIYHLKSDFDKKLFIEFGFGKTDMAAQHWLKYRNKLFYEIIHTGLKAMYEKQHAITTH